MQPAQCAVLSLESNIDMLFHALRAIKEASERAKKSAPVSEAIE